MVYCRSDAACLCLSCDRNVHSANALSKRHSRTLLCERCNSQPALVRCAEERVSLCQNCDWMGHGTSTSASTHKRQTINCYSGCPSAAELSSIWSFVLDFQTAGESACEQELGLMSITDNSTKSSSWGPNEDTVSQNASAVVSGGGGAGASTGGAETSNIHDVDKSGVWVGTSSTPGLGPPLPILERPTGSANNSAFPKVESDFKHNLYCVHYIMLFAGSFGYQILVLSSVS